MTPKPTATRKPRTKPARGKAATKGTRKARTAKPKKAEPKRTRSKLVWRDVSLAILFEPEKFGHHAHLEVRVLAPEGVPIPITETGYRSQFVYPFQIKDAGGPAAYVHRWLEQEAQSRAYLRALARWRQLELF